VSVLTDELNVARQLELVISSDAVEQLNRRLERAENELAAGDVLRDNLHVDHEKVYLLVLTLCWYKKSAFCRLFLLK